MKIDCLKHFKFEEKLYEKYIDKEDLVYIKDFINKIDKTTTTSSPIIKNKVLKPNNKHLTSEDKSRSFNILDFTPVKSSEDKEIIITQPQPSTLYNKYKNILKNMSNTHWTSIKKYK